MELDIRFADQHFDSIRVNGQHGVAGDFFTANLMRKHPTVPAFVELSDDPEDLQGPVLIIESAEHARNLVKGLNRAIDLQWLA